MTIFPRSLKTVVAAASWVYAISLQASWLRMHGNSGEGESSIQQVYGQCNLFYDQITPG